MCNYTIPAITVKTKQTERVACVRCWECEVVIGDLQRIYLITQTFPDNNGVDLESYVRYSVEADVCDAIAEYIRIHEKQEI